MEQGRAGVLLHGGEKLERGVQFQGAISVLINGWENREHKEKIKKDALRMYWKKDEEEDKKMSSKKNRPQEKQWWEEEDEGYNSDLNLKTEYDWEDKTIGNINARLGVEEETDDDGVGGEGKTMMKMMAERKGTTLKRQVGKWWKGLSTTLRRMMMMMTKKGT